MTDQLYPDIDRAFLAESEARHFREERTERDAEALIFSFFHALKNTELYGRQNENANAAVADMAEALRALLAPCSPVAISMSHDACLCNHRRVRITADTLPKFKLFLALMRKWGIGEIAFAPGVIKDELLTLVEVIMACAQLESPCVAIADELSARGIETIAVRRTAVMDYDEDEAASLRRRGKTIFFHTIGAVRELMDQVREKRVLNLGKSRRLVISAVNLIQQDEMALLGMTTIKHYDDYTFNHSVNVAIYSMALGQRIGLPKRLLHHLGIAALFHDIGKTNLPSELLNKQGELTPQELEKIQQHAQHGARIGLRMKWGDLPARVIASAYEHHMKFDLSGYPRTNMQWRPTLFSRIITIADYYDALSRPRVYRSEAFMGDAILHMMLARSGVDFDPILLKVFVTMIGIYPLGSLVRLNNGDLGIVVRTSPDPNYLDRPLVYRLLDETGEKGEVIDLTEIDAESGRYRWNITNMVDPAESHISPEEFFAVVLPGG